MNMEGYRSGHNEAVLKTVCPQGRVGSNPTLSAGDTFSILEKFLFGGMIEKEHAPYDVVSSKKIKE